MKANIEERIIEFSLAGTFLFGLVAVGAKNFKVMILPAILSVVFCAVCIAMSIRYDRNHSSDID